MVAIEACILGSIPGDREAIHRTALPCSQSRFIIKAALVEAPLLLAGDELKHLTSLTVCATSICMTMPSSLRLQRLCVCARNKLCLHFDSVEETGSHLQAFDITCRYLLHQEPIDALQVCIQACDTCSSRSIPCEVHKYSSDRLCLRVLTVWGRLTAICRHQTSPAATCCTRKTSTLSRSTVEGLSLLHAHSHSP